MKHSNVLAMLILLSAAGSSPGAGVEPPWLPAGPPNAFYQDSLPVLYTLPQPATVVVSPALGGRGLRYRLHYMGRPVSRSRVWLLPDSKLVTASLSTRNRWMEINRTSAVRSSREAGSLVPTIYLPITMPRGIAGVIGEGGQLDITGHQKITVSGISHIRPNQVSTEGVTPSYFPDLKMEQELVINLDGTIGEKINVQVDHDTRRTLEPDYNVRLRYTGFDDEVIRSIEMGDVNLSITGPEFVSYSIPGQGLFGAKVEAQVGPLEITTIASKQGSTTASADFVGQATMVTDTLLDIRPAENYFFGVVPDTVPSPVITDIRIFLDDGIENPLSIPGSWRVPLPGGGYMEGPGSWDELQEGPDLDYVLEDDSSTIRFVTPVNSNHMVAVWFVTASGDTTGQVPPGGPYENLLLIKNSNPTVNDPTWQYMLRNRYFLGANNIVRESFSCDIFLDVSGQEPVSSQNGVPFLSLLGLDSNGDGSMVDETATMDWDNGFIVFPDNRPFTSDVLEVKNPAVYTEKNPPTNMSKYFLRVDFRAASTTYSLGHMGIVPGSERVTLTVAGQVYNLVRDQDYTIIYEIGLLTLMGERAEQALDPANTLRVTFEYLPFFAQMSKTLFGTRMKYQMGRLSWIGATVMYENASTPEDRPSPGEENYNTLVMDLDTRLEARPEFLTDAVNALPLVRTEAESMVQLSGEVAMSLPGGGSVAYIDDMEGSQSTYPLGQTRLGWSYSSMPVEGGEASAGNVRWWNWTRRWRMGDIVPGLTGTNASDDVTPMQFYFEPAAGSTESWGGVMRCLDRYGVDLSGRTHISLYVRATGSAQQASLYLDLGERMDEDSYWLERVGDQLILQANGSLDTEDGNGDGILATSEDTGYDLEFSSQEPGYGPENRDPNQDDYVYSADSLPPAQRFDKINGTEGNTRLDTEDLNRNGVLDAANTFYRIRIPLDDPDYIVHGPNEYGWMLISVPLNDSVLVTVPDMVTGEPTWSKIVYARLWVEGFTQPDTLEIYEFGVVGNRWERREIQTTDSIVPPVQPGEQFTVSVVNNRENQEYIDDPPPGVDPGKDDYGNIKLEQSLSLNCVNLLTGHQGVARQDFYTGADYTAYQSFRILVRGAGDQGEAFFQMGRDSINYYELTVPLQQGWQVVDVPLQDLVSLKLLADQQDLEYLRAGNLAVMGSPTLTNVLTLALGVRNGQGSPLTTEVWIDDITLRNRYQDRGYAHRLTGVVNFADLLSMNGDYRMVDANFHSLGSNIGTGTTTTKYSAGATLNLDRFTPPTWGWAMPATYAWSRTLGEPSFRPNSDIRVEGEDSWFQRTDDRAWDTSVQWRRSIRSEGLVGRYFLDPWTLRHTMGEQRGLSPSGTDSVENERFNVGYSLNLGRMRLFRLPILEDFRLRPTRFQFGVKFQRGRDVRWDVSGEDTVQTRNDTQRDLTTDGSVGFNFWKGNSLSYSLSVGRDLYHPWNPGGLSFNAGRETSRDQNLSAAQDINLWSYVVPRVSFDSNYSMFRLSPHTPGADTLGLPDVGLSTSLRYNFRLGLAHTMRRLSRLRDERRDEEAEPGSPRWFLMQMEKWADNINDPTLSYTVTRSTSYKSLEHLPGWRYQFGLEDRIDSIIPYSRIEGENLQIGGGVRPVSTLSLRAEYGNSVSRSYYSGYWNRQETVTWPALTLSWSGLERLRPLEFLRTGTLSSGYRIETVNSSRVEGGEETPVSETVSRRFSPLLSVTASLKNKVQITVSDNLTLTENRNFTGTSAVTEGTSRSSQVGVSYAFRAPEGISIPLPLLNRIRIRFQSELTTGLKITRSLTKSEIIRDVGEDILQTDRTEWRIEPYANYDFGTVQAGLTIIYGWKKDRVNSQYDQTDVGLDLWVMINF